MRYRTALLSATALLVGFSFVSSANAQVPESERVLITDPSILDALGYPQDAKNVYRWVRPGAGESERLDQSGSRGAPSPSYLASSGFEFHPFDHTTEYLKGPSFLVNNGALVSLTAGGSFESQLRLPQGATWQWLDILGSHDHSTQNLVVTAVERCLPFLVGGNPTETVLGTETITDADGEFGSDISVDVPIDNTLCSYHARAVFGSGAGSVPSVLIQLAKVRAQFLP